MEKIPIEMIQKIAIELDNNSLINLCKTNKFINEIINDYHFLKNYARKYLTINLEKIPKNNDGKYMIIKELDKLKKYSKYTFFIEGFLVRNEYDIYVKNNIDNLHMIYLYNYYIYYKNKEMSDFLNKKGIKIEEIFNDPHIY